ncbi:18943_t:CDS:2, partial [Dentiscutata erythropus]
MSKKPDNRITKLNFNSYYFDHSQFDALIKNFFTNYDTCIFKEFVYQYEKNHNSNQERDCHIQAFFSLVNQQHLPSVFEKLKTNNALEKWYYDPVKSVKDSILYSICRYSYNDLTDLNRCVWCTLEYCSQRTLARYDSESRPFYYKLEDYKKKQKCFDKVENNPKHVYTFDESRVGKGYLFSLLFPDAYKRKSADGKFLQDFNSSYKEVLINEFKEQIKYLELLNLLDNKDYSVQIKCMRNENFCPKVIEFLANTNIRFIYDFCKDEELKPIAEQKFNNSKLFSVFANRLNYIVEFKKFRIDKQKPSIELFDPQIESSKRKISIDESNYDSDLYSDNSQIET